jgi:hypothetical protein
VRFVGCAALTAALIACTGSADSGSAGGSNSTGERMLVDHLKWELVTGDDHPFTNGAPADGDCPSVAFQAEAGFFEVETDSCAWSVFSQPLLADASAGEMVEFVSWHLDLWAPEQATARVVFQIGEEVLWDETFDVPGPAAIEPHSIPLSSRHVAGEVAYWHIANHGYNSWRLGDLVTLPDG